MENETEVERTTHLSNLSDYIARKQQSYALSLAVWF